MATQYTDGYATYYLVETENEIETYQATRNEDCKWLGYVSIKWNHQSKRWEGKDNKEIWGANTRLLALQFTDRFVSIPESKGA